MRITDIEIVATMLKSLKRIHFGISNLNHVKIFLGANSKLEYIQIDWFMDEAGKVDKKKVLDLIGLNKKRAELPNSKKVTLFVEEPVYLATKLTYRMIDLDFIKLKRTDSLNDENYDFKLPIIYN